MDISINGLGMEDETALHLACRMNRPKAVLELLGHRGTNVNQSVDHSSSGTFLHWACLHGHTKVVRELLKHPDIRVNQRNAERDGSEGWSSLRCCLYGEGRLATLKELLKHPGLDRGDMEEALLHAQADRRLSLCARAIADAL